MHYPTVFPSTLALKRTLIYLGAAFLGGLVAVAQTAAETKRKLSTFNRKTMHAEAFIWLCIY